MNKEEKAKAYDEALERLKPLYEQAKKDDSPIWSTYEYIFPELKESEDERIRKAILGLAYLDGIEPILTKCSVTRSDILSYLEKQREQKPDNPCDGCNNYKGCITCVDGDQWAHIEEEPTNSSSEKPNNQWNEEDEKMLDSIINVLEVMPSANFIPIKRETMIPWLKSLLERFNLQPKQEWSEEDERMLSRCVKSLESSKQFADSDTFKKAKDTEIDWLKNRLKSLRPQQKVEWSEEDENMFENFMHKLEVCDLLTNKEISWAKLRLKSLHPQSKQEWSEEDEKKIKKAIWLIQRYTIDDYKQSLRKEAVNGLKSLHPSWTPSMDKHIPERIFLWKNEMNEFLNGERKQVQIGINQDNLPGLLTYVLWKDVSQKVEQSEVDKFDCPTTPIEEAIEVTSRMQYIDEEMKPIAKFIMDYASWNLHKDEWNHPVIEVPLFRVLDALIQRGKPYCDAS